MYVSPVPPTAVVPDYSRWSRSEHANAEILSLYGLDLSELTRELVTLPFLRCITIASKAISMGNGCTDTVSLLTRSPSSAFAVALITKTVLEHPRPHHKGAVVVQTQSAVR